MTKVLFYVLFSLLLQGCVGGAYLSSFTTEIADRGLYKERGSLRKKTESSLNTKSSIEASWGKPDRTTDVTWVYKQKRSRMFGVVIALVIPIPLYLPVGKEEYILSFDGDYLTKIEERQGKVVGGFCGLIPDKNTHIELKFGCDTVNE
jgi:hypothetical protein